MKIKLERKPEIILSQVIKEAKSAFPGYEVIIACSYYSQVQIKIINYSSSNSIIDESLRKLELLQLINVGVN